MRALLDNQGLLNVTTFVDAVDGFELSLAQMQREGLHPMPGWPLETKSLVQIADSVNARCGLEAARDLYGHAATFGLVELHLQRSDACFPMWLSGNVFAREGEWTRL